MKPRSVLLLALLTFVPAHPHAAAASESLLLRLVVLRPGTVVMDGADLIDLTGDSERAPVPWTEFSIQEVPVAPGRHTLLLRPADRSLLPPFESVSITGAAGDTVTVELGRPVLLTSPSGARVLAGGRTIGETPVRLPPELLWGTDLLVDLDGYRRVTLPGDSVLADTRVSGSKRVELDPLAPPVPARLRASEGSWWARNRALAIGGSVTLLAAGVYTAVRFKDQADDRYDAYLRTGNRDRQKRLFDDAVRFDRLSLVGWAVGEAAFLATFFLIIHEEPRGLVPTAAVDLEPATGEARYRLGVRHGF